MKKEAEIRRKLRSLASLGEIVGAMKSLSAQHFRETRDAIAPARDYRASVEAVLATVGSQMPVREGPVGVLVLGGDFGLSGTYHSALADASSQHLAEVGAGPLFVVGRRTALLLGRRGHATPHAYDAPTGVKGIPNLLLPLVEALFATYVESGLSALDVVSSHFAGIGVHTPTVTRLLSLSAQRTRDPGPRPRYTTPEELSSAAGRELLYVHLYELLVDALAAEHGARLAATEAAEGFLEKRTLELERRLVSARREGSTQEMLEIVSGARARLRALDEEPGNEGMLR